VNTPAKLHALAGGDWRVDKAHGIESGNRELVEALRMNEKAHAIFEADGDERACVELRAVCSLLRGRIADRIDKARLLRSEARDEPHPELPRATTTRRGLA